MEKLGFGYVSDNDESLQTKAGGKFGMNTGFITAFAYNAAAGKDGAEGHAIDITLMIGQKEFRRRVYDITGPLFKNSEQVAVGEAGYVELYNSEITQRMAVITHVIKALGVTDEQIKAALATPPADFIGWAKIMTSLPGDGFETRPVDAFLEWEWSIGKDNTQTFLQLAKNMKGGRFLCPAQTAQGAWTPVRDGKGLKYVDGANNEHPFSRSTDYMDSNKAKQQKEGEEEEAPAGMGSMDAGSTDKPTASSW